MSDLHQIRGEDLIEDDELDSIIRNPGDLREALGNMPDEDAKILAEAIIRGHAMRAGDIVTDITYTYANKVLE